MRGLCPSPSPLPFGERGPKRPIPIHRLFPLGARVGIPNDPVSPIRARVAILSDPVGTPNDPLSLTGARVVIPSDPLSPIGAGVGILNEPLSPIGGESRVRGQVCERPRQYARRLRRSQTDAERTLWLRLRDPRLTEFKFRRQHPIGPFVADFCCTEAKVVVELDGGQHARQRRSDATRTAFLEAQGYRVLRFWDSVVLSKIEGVLERIAEALRRRESRPSPYPLPRGERGSEGPGSGGERGSEGPGPRGERGSEGPAFKGERGGERAIPMMPSPQRGTRRDVQSPPLPHRGRGSQFEPRRSPRAGRRGLTW
jgi:very-short-patch-repair endonuclease